MNDTRDLKILLFAVAGYAFIAGALLGVLSHED